MPMKEIKEENQNVMWQCVCVFWIYLLRETQGILCQGMPITYCSISLKTHRQGQASFHYSNMVKKWMTHLQGRIFSFLLKKSFLKRICITPFNHDISTRFSFRKICFQQEAKNVNVKTLLIQIHDTVKVEKKYEDTFCYQSNLRWNSQT